MNLFSKRTHSTVGTLPGTPVYTGDNIQDMVTIDVISYNSDRTETGKITNLAELKNLDEKMFHWININGLHDIELLQALGSFYEIHPLLLEDIVDTEGRPKLDSFDTHVLIILKMISAEQEGDGTNTEQVSIVYGKNHVITFQEHEGDVFDPVRDRILNGKGRIRSRKADYLFYSLIDIVVDNYFLVIDRYTDIVEPIEDEIIRKPVKEHAQLIHDLKKQLLYLRKAIWPLREVLNVLLRDHLDKIEKENILYFRDVHEHVIQAVDYIEHSRDMLIGLYDSYTSAISNSMNSVMKIMSLIATIFIPLTFIAGVYGMNFHNMPELGWDWAYYAVLGIMAITGIGMFIVFKFKKWF